MWYLLKQLSKIRADNPLSIGYSGIYCICKLITFLVLLRRNRNTYNKNSFYSAQRIYKVQNDNNDDKNSQLDSDSNSADSTEIVYDI